MAKRAENYRRATILFLITGLFFILLGISGDKAVVFLPIGAFCIIIGMAFWQLNRKKKESG